MLQVLVIPYDVRVPKVRISTHLVDELRNQRCLQHHLHSVHCERQLLLTRIQYVFLSAHSRIVIRIDGWEVDSQYPHGHFVCSIGPIGDVETETKTILLEHGLFTQPFTKAQVRECDVHSVVR